MKILAEEFLARALKRHGRQLDGIDPDALAAMERHTWPGNVRELENMIERAVTLESGKSVSLQSLPKAVQMAAPSQVASSAMAGSAMPGLDLPERDFSGGALDLDAILGTVEKAYLEAALAHSGGVRKKAADLLGITFRSLRYRLKKLGMVAGEDDEEE